MILITVVVFFGCDQNPPPNISRNGPPNIIIILTDDQGYADVGVYGATGFTTPNLDRMAKEGIRFSSFYVTNAVCTPSRASLLTGSYAMRVSMPLHLLPNSKVGLHPDEVTIADLVKERGYVTAAIGKWHLGDDLAFLPTANGFDSYFGIPYSHGMSSFMGVLSAQPPLPLMRDTEVIEREPDQRLLTSRYTEEAVKFIEQNAKQPFLLYLAHSMPHVPLWASEQFKGSTQRGLYGDVIEEIDWSTGAILETLERLGLDGNTLVVFTSDNGPWNMFGNHSGSAKPFRGGKGTTFEGGHRVPAIMRWPGFIPEGRVVDEMVTAMDLFPTIAALTGATWPTDRVIDGHDISPILRGDAAAASPYDRFYYYRVDQLQAVRSGPWKLHVAHKHYTLEGGRIGNDGAIGAYAKVPIEQSLFDLRIDPGETRNVAAAHPDVVERLMAMIEEGRQELGDKLTGTVGTGTRPQGRLNP